MANKGNPPYRLTACHLTMASELVPFAEVSIDAENDKAAIERASKWALSLRHALKEEAWLVVQQESRNVYHERFDGSL